MHTGSGARRPPQLITTPSAQTNRLSPSDPITPFPTSVTRSRTGHACDRCRAMRTKCSGGTRCTKCIKDDAICVYGDRKRERNKKDLAESVDRIQVLQDENRELVAALKTLTSRPGFNPKGNEGILQLLANYDDQPEGSHDSRSRTQSLRSPTFTSDGADSSHSEPGKHGRAGEQHIPSTIGSPGHQGELPKLVDMDHGMGASGFVGKISEMSWMQRAREYLIKNTQPVNVVAQEELDQHAKDAQTLTYYMDDTNLLSVDEDHVDPLHTPTYQLALILSEAYFHATQGAFSLILREQFLDRLVQFLAHKTMLTWQDRRWLAIANLVWAVGSKWLHLVKYDRNFPEDHLTYYARARALGLDHRILFDHPDVDMVEGIGILSLYLFVNGSISRAWNILGNAVRHATTLGLHLRVSDVTIDEIERERRARTWFSLYKLEILISETTGRPQSIQTAQITIPLETIAQDSYRTNLSQESEDISAMSRVLWTDFLQSFQQGTHTDSETPTVWSSITPNNRDLLARCFGYHIRLCRISDDITSKLYTGTADYAWSVTQDQIRRLQKELGYWVDNLPEELKLDTQAEIQLDPRAKIELAMYYHSVCMILYRPCLCEIIIEDESLVSQSFNQDSARACVRAAMAMLDLTPDRPVAHEIMQLLPWWTLLHYICQAAGVLLLELCLDCQHFQGRGPEVMTAMRKAMSYLWAMSEQSMSAYRAWRIFKGLLLEVCGRYGGPRILDIKEDAPRPAGWTDHAEASVVAVFA